MRVVGCISLNKDRPGHVRSVDHFGQLCLVWLRQNEIQKLEEEEFEIIHPEVGPEFIKKWWSLFSKVASVALPHNGKGLVKGEP